MMSMSTPGRPILGCGERGKIKERKINSNGFNSKNIKIYSIARSAVGFLMESASYSVPF